MFRQGGDRYAQAQMLDHLGDAQVPAGVQALGGSRWRSCTNSPDPDVDTMHGTFDVLF